MGSLSGVHGRTLNREGIRGASADALAGTPGSGDMSMASLAEVAIEPREVDRRLELLRHEVEEIGGARPARNQRTWWRITGRERSLTRIRFTTSALTELI